MRLVLIRTEEELQGLQPAWNALLRESAADTIFLTWEWVWAWWGSYGTPGDLRVLAVFDEDNVLRGVAPLRHKRAGRYGQSVPALTFLVDGSNDSEYLDFFAASGYEAPVMEMFRSHLEEELKRGTVLLLNELPEASPTFGSLREMAAGAGISTESDIACGTVRLPGTWDAYLSSLRPRFRTKVRSALRHFEGSPDVRFGFCQTEDDLLRMLPVLFDLHARRWQQDGKPGVFGWPEKRAFYFALSPLLLKQGSLRFSWLEWKGRVIACQYGFAYHGTYFHLQEGYEPACEHWSTGIGLRAWCFRQFIADGIREYDFLGGIGRHKTDWGAEAKNSKNLQIAASSWKNRVFCLGPQWESQTKESVRAMLPESLLTMRGAWHNGAKAVLKQRLRQIAASTYFHLGMPFLLRGVRDRYQVSRSGCSRRSQPAARILYYHRVNDQNDPFFPAISTELFHQEMRLLARCHKVVSLAQVADHLESGSPESVLAITFDDGYADNYANALPILQRYNLPATVFLTTGSIDSREPLWFEQLAEAAKRTSVEYVDLEFDLPRRFWFRTEAERLDSNGRLFALLRNLEDAERRCRLTGILRQLPVTGQSERRDQMLTWDQVRGMAGHRIDFGGHTVSHPFVSKLTADQAEWEVSASKQRIEDQIQRTVEHFAYPNGREEDIGLCSKEIIRRAGYRGAVTTIWGLNYRSTDPMELRRGGPWEENPAMFAYKLDWYQFLNH